MCMKRFMDIIGGFIGCLMTGILFLFLAPAIYLKSPGPVFFRQKRAGLNGRPFVIYKFRSMYPNADAVKEALSSENRIRGGRMFKLSDDPRIIGSGKKDRHGRPKGIGHFIRRTSLDEFPQFFNVLKGEMSLVGTRPPTMDEWERYNPEERFRLKMRPGITGLWQVSGRSRITDFDQVLSLDRYYIEHWSLLLDMKILLKTLKVILTRDGAL